MGNPAGKASGFPCRPGPVRVRARAGDWRSWEAYPARGAAVTWDELLDYCLAKPGAWRDEPWEGDVVVKVGSKIFAFLGTESADAVGLKCGQNRETADEWLLQYPEDAAKMAYIGRSGWNSLRFAGAIPRGELLEAVDASYETVVSKLPKKDRPAAS